MLTRAAVALRSPISFRKAFSGPGACAPCHLSGVGSERKQPASARPCSPTTSQGNPVCFCNFCNPWNVQDRVPRRYDIESIRSHLVQCPQCTLKIFRPRSSTNCNSIFSAGAARCASTSSLSGWSGFRKKAVRCTRGTTSLMSLKSLRSGIVEQQRDACGVVRGSR